MTPLLSPFIKTLRAYYLFKAGLATLIIKWIVIIVVVETTATTATAVTTAIVVKRSSCHTLYMSSHGSSHVDGLDAAIGVSFGGKFDLFAVLRRRKKVSECG